MIRLHAKVRDEFGGRAGKLAACICAYFDSRPIKVDMMVLGRKAHSTTEDQHMNPYTEGSACGTYTNEYTTLDHMDPDKEHISRPTCGPHFSAAERRQFQTRKQVTNSWVTTFGFQHWLRMAAYFLAPWIDSLVSQRQ
jgi:hypothetical protein